MQTHSSRVESGGVQSQGEFRIKNSAKAFSILSSGLYSNKYQAVLRELGCNAYDSHVEAGKADVPFTVQLPTRLEPTFSIRDYGTGLDHESVINIYTTYFESTKQDSNDFVGCMGLGSKSPFSYTDTFSVIAIKDGMRRVYTAFINEQGVPTIALMSEGPTDESNGVEVSFSVNENGDIYNFEREAQSVYRWFRTKPEIVGARVSIPEIEYSEKDIAPGIHVRKNGGSSAYAIMGNVAYPITLPAVDTSTEKGKRREEIRRLLRGSPLVIEFRIGELDVAASREELSYIPHTIESIYARGEELLKHLTLYVQKEVQKAKTKWDRHAIMCRILESDRSMFGPALGDYVAKNPKEVYPNTKIDHYYVHAYLKIADFEQISDLITMSSFSINERGQGTRLSVSYSNMDRIVEVDPITNAESWVPSWKIEPSATIIFQDDRSSVIPRIKAEYSKSNHGILGGPDKRNGSYNHVLLIRLRKKPDNLEDIKKRVFALFAGAPIHLTSSLPKVSTLTAGKKFSVYTVAKGDPYRRGYGYASGSSNYRLELVKDHSALRPAADGKYYYLPMIGKSIQTSKGMTQGINDFARIVTSRGIEKFLGLRVLGLYALNKTSQKAVKDDDEWVNVFDYFVEQFDKIDWPAAQKIVESKTKSEAIASSSSLKLQYINKSQLSSLSTNPASLFDKVVKLYQEAQYDDNSHNYQNIMLFRQGLDSKLPHETVNKLLTLPSATDKRDYLQSLVELESKVFERYPMLRYVSLNSGDVAWKAITDYIALVDKSL